jgi:hypothetical protein
MNEKSPIDDTDNGGAVSTPSVGLDPIAEFLVTHEASLIPPWISPADWHWFMANRHHAPRAIVIKLPSGSYAVANAAFELQFCCDEDAYLYIVDDVKQRPRTARESWTPEAEPELPFEVEL